MDILQKHFKKDNPYAPLDQILRYCVYYSVLYDTNVGLMNDNLVIKNNYMEKLQIECF